MQYHASVLTTIIVLLHGLNFESAGLNHHLGTLFLLITLPQSHQIASYWHGFMGSIVGLDQIC